MIGGGEYVSVVGKDLLFIVLVGVIHFDFDYQSSV